MRSRSESARRAALPAIFLLAMALAVAAAATSPAAAGPLPAAATAQDEPAQAGAPEAEGEGRPAHADAEPAEIEWLTDETGKRYRIQKIPKGVEGRDYIWLSESRIQIKYGLPLDVTAHDDETFSVKVYETTPSKPRPAKPEITEEDRARVAAEYRTEIETADRLRFVGFDEGLPKRGQWRNGFDVADMNGDGHLDIVFGPRRKGPPTPNIFLGDGRGNWRTWSEARYPPFPYDYGDAAAADFNGDGHMDLALAIHLRGMAAMAGDGEGGFSAWSEGIGIETPGQGGGGTTFSSRALAAPDWNGDGRPDLLAIGEGPKGLMRAVKRGSTDPLTASRGPLVYLNNGDGSWTAKRSGDEAIFGDAIVTGDFDGDRRLDFATASHQRGNRNILHLGLGDGGWSALPVDALRPGSTLRALASSDLDGDGRDDLVVGFTGIELGVWRTGVDVLHSRPENRWERRSVYAAELQDGIFAVDSGDLDGDRAPDLVALTGKGEVWVFLGDGAGGYVREDSPELPARAGICRGYGLRLVDLDGDGRDEVVAAFAGEAAGLTGMVSEPGCEGEGRIWAWKSVPASGTAPDLTPR